MENPKTPSPEELILAMLREVLANQARLMGLDAQTPKPAQPPLAPTEPPRPLTPTPLSSPNIEPEPTVSATLTPDAAPSHARRGESVRVSKPEAEQEEKLTHAELTELEEHNNLAAQPLGSSNMPRTLKWIAAIVLGLIVFINLPIFGGLALARALPDQQALIIRDGLVLKGSGEKIFVLEDNQKHWISSLQLFERDYRWQDVHIVDDAFLAQFPDGRPLYLVLKCDSPHIYRIEDGKKRWIQDIPTFLNEGLVWDDVHYVSCSELRRIPDGIPLPPTAGTPPTP